MMDALLGHSPNFLSHLHNPQMIYQILSEITKYYPYGIYNIQWEIYHTYLWNADYDNVKDFFAEKLDIHNLEHPTDILVFINIIDGFINFGQQFYTQNDVVRKLEEVKTEVLQRFRGHALINLYTNYHKTQASKGFYSERIVNPEEVFDRNKRQIPTFPIQNPIIQISQDKAIEMDHNNMIPLYAYTLSADRQYSRKTHHKNLFDSYEWWTDEDYQYLIQLIHHPNIMSITEETFAFKFSDFPFSIQPALIQFLAHATVWEAKQFKFYMEEAKSLKEKYLRLRVFLGVSIDPKLKNTILSLESNCTLALGESVWKSFFAKILEKYNHLVAIAEKDAEEIQWEFFGSDSTAKFSKREYIGEVLKKANNLLLDIDTELVDRMIETDEAADESYMQKVTTLFESYNSEMIHYGSLFRVTEKDTRGWLDTTMKNLGITMRTRKWTELEEKDWEIVRRFYEVNYAHDPRYEQIEDIVAGSESIDSLTRDIEYSFFSYRDEPLLTIKFMKQWDGSIYFWAFNAAIQFQKYSFGGFALGEMLKEYEWKTIHAHVIEWNEHLLGYYERFGFKALTWDDEKPLLIEEGGVKFYHIVRKS
jgi:hypothetical protein